ncbi:MAG: D-aminoacyl-tRNA deacylase [Crocinitomicaceae bacterium]|nr:D-aminoacyl-tRNA deacylase [Crocinitomicaceae bacterium]
MRLVIQRAKNASVTIDDKINGSIDSGLVVLIGIEHDDTLDDISWLVAKLVNLRIFSDEDGKMNKSIQEINGQFLIISQFTLHASTKKGNRPSYIKAARPEVAIPLYNQFIQELKIQSQLTVETGIFGTDMQVQLINDGPVTIFIDSKNKE